MTSLFRCFLICLSCVKCVVMAIRTPIMERQLTRLWFVPDNATQVHLGPRITRGQALGLGECADVGSCFGLNKNILGLESLRRTSTRGNPLEALNGDDSLRMIGWTRLLINNFWCNGFLSFAYVCVCVCSTSKMGLICKFKSHPIAHCVNMNTDRIMQIMSWMNGLDWWGKSAKTIW